jgi:plastocyanin
MTLILASCGGSGHGSDTSAKGSDTAVTRSAASGPPVEIPQPGPGASPRVTVKDFIFRPSPDEVAVGTKLTWSNQDDLLHTVTSGVRGKPDGKFDSKLDGVGTEFSFTFTQAGTFPFFCRIHPGTEGQIVVK